MGVNGSGTDRPADPAAGVEEDVILLGRPGRRASAAWNAAIDAAQGDVPITCHEIRALGPEVRPDLAQKGPTSLEALTAVVLGQIELRRPFRLIGHQIGALVALRVACDHPDLATRVLAIDPPRPYWWTPASAAARPSPSARVPDRRQRIDGWSLAEIPTVSDLDLAALRVPVCVVATPQSDSVTGGDHIARMVPTAILVRMHSNDDEAATEAMARFLRS